MPFKKGHPKYTKKLHVFTQEERGKSHATIKKNGVWNKGKKLPNQTGEKHHNWKGGYQNRLHNNRLRNDRLRGSGGRHSFLEWETLKAQYNWTCPCCGKSEPAIKLTRDHIVPVIKGGSNNIENIQPLCLRCNRGKWMSEIKY